MSLFGFIVVALIVGLLISLLFRVTLGTAIVVAIVAAIGFGLFELLLKGIFATAVFGVHVFGGVIGFLIFLVIAIIVAKYVSRRV